MELIYVGNKMYFDSGTTMSCIYEKRDGKYYRMDWGLVEKILDSGVDVNIRKATHEEMEYFEALKLRIQAKRIEMTEYGLKEWQEL